MAAMGVALAHRGPDSEGRFIDNAVPVGFAHRRLAILDLSPSGHQPMTSRSGRYVITYNGELYNFRELASQLGEDGLASDTAVLLGCLERFGVADALPLFNGMFAFAVLDRRDQVVHLVRDRLGEKPLYVGRDRGCVLFASELRSIEAGCGRTFDVDPAAVEELLRFKCIGGDRTIYRGVQKVLPGHHITLDANSGDVVSLRAYWTPPRPFVAGSSPVSIDDLDAVLEESVALRLRSDVPVGALLSGGVDSALVTALAAKHQSHLHTFTAGFSDAHYDERAPARAVASSLGTEHHEFEFAEHDLLGIVTDLPATYDEPFADSSAIPTLALSRFVRPHVKVVLTGDGGDELFGGYPRYRLAPKTWRLARHVPGAFAADRARVIQRALNPFERFSPRFPRSLRERSLGWVAGLLASSSTATSFDEHYRNVRSDTHRPMSLLNRSWRHESTPTPAPTAAGSDSLLATMMRSDLMTYLPDDILVKVDRAAMSVGLETRIPLLDPTVLDLAWRMPRVVGPGEGHTKGALRQLLARHLPGVDVPLEKRGFGVPLASWLRGPLRPWAQELLSPEAVSEIGFLDAQAVTALWVRHQSGKNEQHPLWAVLMLQAWALKRAEVGSRG
ncbi:MAG: hypothetical protein QOJ00_1749 [Actinomycetota bacterium]